MNAVLTLHTAFDVQFLAVFFHVNLILIRINLSDFHLKCFFVDQNKAVCDLLHFDVILWIHFNSICVVAFVWIAFVSVSRWIKSLTDFHHLYFTCIPFIILAKVLNFIIQKIWRAVTGWKKNYENHNKSAACTIKCSLSHTLCCRIREKKIIK